MKKKSPQPQSETNDSKVGSKSGDNTKLEKPGVRTPTGEGNGIPNQHAHPAEVALRCVLSALPSSFKKSEYSKKCIEIAAAAVQPHVIVVDELLSPATDPTQANFWAALINQNCYRSTTQLIEAGKNLVAAKAKLEHREWIKLFDQRLIPLHKREAQRLMQVAQHPILSKANNCSLLPPSPQALSALSQAEPKALEQALTTGQINPRMTIAEAKTFQREHPAPGAKIKPAGPLTEYDLNKRLAYCSTVLWGEMEKCPPPHVDGLADGIQDMATQILEAARAVQIAHPSAAIEQSTQADNGTSKPPEA